MPSKNYITGFQVSQVGKGIAFEAFKSNRLTASTEVQKRVMDLSWLEACAPHYMISNDPNDYVFGICRALTADLPNRNGHMFTLDQLQAFNIKQGCQSFKTFEGKPLLINHEYNLPKAAGILISSRLIQDGPYVVVELVAGADRTKNAEVASHMDQGIANFSMGADAQAFKCSVCGAEFDLASPCRHCANDMLLRRFGKDQVVSCMKVIGLTFVEHSCLLNQGPADPRAVHSNISIS